MLKSFFQQFFVGVVMFANLLLVMCGVVFVAQPYFVPCGVTTTAAISVLSAACFMVLTTQIALYLFPRYMKGL